ncbi:PREDICTED: homeobox protein BarH-like 1b isoform X2 [Nicrophorus vespilloides]|uniref:Homeobox protein BarH-like 1b isoform X2 n=1 Tax=Nicrophorus vespilloides TaxID=110193 RepID=A0ABM1MNM5_NICVS|nr:PREDICTED: homeobox protein BarH-like 1b isoform X2 [Nicrophorus vespilloides]
MLHHYNYSTSLSHFLSYHQFEDQTSNENDQSTASALCEDDARCKGGSVASNKSFTIAAILGLKGAEEKVPVGDDLNVVNLSVHPGGTDGSARALVSNCSRLQLPGRHSSSAVAVTGHHYSVGPGCAQPRHAVRGLKQLSNLANKKSCKSKRVRTIFTPEQLERLEAEFERQQYMVGPERLYLAHTLQLTEAQCGFRTDG